jgi:hypothetical protein
VDNLFIYRWTGCLYSESARFNCLRHGMVGLLNFALCSVSMNETKPFLKKIWVKI